LTITRVKDLEDVQDKILLATPAGFEPATFSLEVSGCAGFGFFELQQSPADMSGWLLNLVEI
jgi:hypothetical protein